MEAPPRRQNRSCDRCRRSKRRCILETSHNEQCRNCARLGDKCTFTLAATIAAKKRQRSFHNAGPDLVEPAAHIEVDADAVFTNATERTVSLSFDSSSPVLQGSFDNIWSPPSIFSVPFCFENLFSELVDGPPGIENVFEPEEAMHLSLSNDDDFTVSSHGLSTDGSQMMHLLDSRDEVLSSTASTNTPTSLLTSTLDSSITNQYLDKFFHALTTVLYHRYLSPRANIAARVPTYEILPNDASDKLLGPPNDSVLGQSTLHLQASRTEDQVSNSSDIVKVSVVGAARFLDNFALLYGNHRARGERQRDEEILRLVVQAIALNHSPFSDRGDQQTGDQSKLVADAWFRAYSSLVESISRRSFVLIYAAFTFDLASAVPELVTAEHPDIDTTLLLDHALRQLDHLSRLLRDFCSCLPEKSSYRRRLQTCLRIMMWHGYVRDTVCSFRRYRQCILEDIPLSSMNSQPLAIPCYENDFDALNRDIPSTCERAFGRCFAAYRLIATIQTAFATDEPVDVASIGQHAASIVELAKSFQSTYSAWNQICLSQFSQLSTQSQLSIGFLTIFWNLAILRLYDVTNNVQTRSAFRPDDLVFVTEHRSKAISAFAVIADLILGISEDNDLPILDHGGVRLAFVAHHANSALMAFALETAVRHTIEQTSDEPMTQYSKRKNALRPLVWCLLSMERTNAGRTVARPALDRLMSQYGDAILESWTPEGD